MPLVEIMELKSGEMNQFDAFLPVKKLIIISVKFLIGYQIVLASERI